MARPNDTPIIRIRRVTTGEPGEGGGEPAPSQGTVPTGPSGEPIVTIGIGEQQGVAGPPAPPTPPPVSPVVPIPPAPPVVEPPKPQPPPPPQDGFSVPPVGPPVVLDWWQSMDITSRQQLENLFEEFQGQIRLLTNQLAAARDRIAELESAPPTKGDKGDPGEPGVDGKDGTNGRDGINGRDGRNGVDATPFTMTGQYRDLVNATGAANQKANDAQATANAAFAEAGRALVQSNTALNRLGAIAANPNYVNVGPSMQDIQDAVALYLRQNPITGGAAGKDGMNATPAMVRDAVDTWLKANPIAGVTTTMITDAVNSYLRDHPPSVTVTGGGGTAGPTTVVQQLGWNDLFNLVRANENAFLRWLLDQLAAVDVYTEAELEAA